MNIIPQNLRHVRTGFVLIVFLSFVFTLGIAAQPSVRFAVIGDYGRAGQDEADVARLIKSWRPDFIITTGDNNYPDGEDSTIDENIGQYYHEFISPYYGSFGAGDTVNRFFPSLGNHDWRTPGAAPYLAYFTLPGNERYYDFVRGPVHLFAIDSDVHEPDGVTASSIQAQWLKEQLARSTAPWKIVYFHHPPYTSAEHGNAVRMQWPFAEWGATAVLAGHDHTYERLHIGGIVYFVNGTGGNPSLYDFKETIEGSAVRFNREHGGMEISADQDSIVFRFVTTRDSVVDRYVISSAR